MARDAEALVEPQPLDRGTHDRLDRPTTEAGPAPLHLGDEQDEVRGVPRLILEGSVEHTSEVLDDSAPDR